MSLIEVKNLNFEYPKKRVLKDINFEIAEGSVTALVGPNGAGKTTLMRCMTSLETPMTGHVILDGIDVHDRPRAAHKAMGYLSDFFGVYSNLTVRQCLTYMAWCHKVPAENLDRKIEELAKEVDIETYLDQKAGALSRGYKQRLGVGLALVHSPKCLFLDEPASGMDPEARIRFSELMTRLRLRGYTIIVSSHIFSELEDYCTDMLVIREGEIKSHVRLSERQAAQQVDLHISLRTPDEKHLQFIRDYDGTDDVRAVGGDVTLTFTGADDRQQDFLAALVKAKIPVYRFMAARKTLKTAYMDLADKKEIETP